MPQMTMKEIVAEMIAHYNAPEKFGFDQHRWACAYKTESGAMCAVGRCLIDPESVDEGSVYDIAPDRKKLDGMLKEQYRGCSQKFWSLCQDFHDSCAENSVTSMQSVVDAFDAGKQGDLRINVRCSYESLLRYIEKESHD